MGGAAPNLWSLHKGEGILGGGGGGGAGGTHGGIRRRQKYIAEQPWSRSNGRPG